MSERKLSDCAGSEYFKYRLDFVKKHYILYDCAFEGIRDACTKNGYKCDFHPRFDNPDLLTDGRSDIPSKRVHPPVPSYAAHSDGFNFHYSKAHEMVQGQLTEKYTLTLKKVQCEAENQEIDDYCPHVQLERFLDDCRMPKLSFEQTAHSVQS